jgi:hypothetical protein
LRPNGSRASGDATSTWTPRCDAARSCREIFPACCRSPTSAARIDA